ncbi:peptidoglycan D,D-transpeptidase FtsI family protein [Laceyella putida]|uniref:Peptidoglycan D,D-transpeptidase FtsI family protein n=1 Tax=Laceyella putida TaxID=110101 RepID=A0ABW2RKA6_9BACL
MRKWRTWLISFGLIATFGLIVWRLYYIQIEATRSFSMFNQRVDLIKLAEERHQEEMLLNSGRGAILDRHGERLAGGDDYHLLVFPQTPYQLKSRAKQFAQLASFIHMPVAELADQLARIRFPLLLSGRMGEEMVLSQADKEMIRQLNLPGVLVVRSDYRMAMNQPAQQVLGRVIQNPALLKAWYPDHVANGQWSPGSYMGVTGIEASFEPFLHGGNEERLAYTTMGSGLPLIGGQMKLKQNRAGGDAIPYTVVTTLDKEIQLRVEQILREENMQDGAVVVQEIASGDILAMASRPAVTKGENENQPWDNRALLETTPGSIFKTVIAVAALEQGIVKPDTVFHCDGELEQARLTDEQPHGRQTFAEAYADSCNVVLGMIAQKLGAEQIEAYAKRLGLTQEVIWSGKVFHDKHFKQLPQEQKGMVFAKSTPKNDLGVKAQTGIGQRDVRVTPLQAANMVTALFHQGKPPKPRVVKEIQDGTGQVIYRFQPQYVPEAQPLKPETIEAMKRMMRMVVTEGTGQSIAHAEWPLAAKTGTAQIGMDKKRYNKWMIGFGPYAKPKVAISVVLRGIGNPDDPRAKRIFMKITDEIAKLGKSDEKQR